MTKDAIVVIVDQFTKIIKLKAITRAVSSEDIAKIYSDKIWKFLVTEGLNLPHDLWKTLTKYWKQKKCYLQHIILR